MIKIREKYDIELFKSLKIDCSKCYGFCCVALYFSKSDGFLKDKCGGTPCTFLNKDFTCKIHKDLRNKGLKGCTSYDCFGAGQKVASETYKNKNWVNNPHLAKEMFDVFVVMRQLHEMLWYLCDGLTFTNNPEFNNKLKNLINETYEMSKMDSEYLLKLNLDKHRDKINAILKLVGNDVRHKLGNKNIFIQSNDLMGKDLSKTNLIGANLAGALLIATDLRNTDLSGAMIIGADMRDTDIRGANLKNTMFLTQSQVNTAKGNKNTILPKELKRPSYWE